MNNEFEVLLKSHGDSRLGLLRTKRGSISTPAFFPILNFMTGPPGIERNGGIWRHLKIEFIKNRKINHLMTQIMHFTDFNLSPSVWNSWLYKETKNVTLHDWIKSFLGRDNYNIQLFFDSGGFKLLYNSEYDVEKYGFTATQRSILNLQMSLGADIIATLDYPLPLNISEDESKIRINKSIENAIEALKILKEYPPDKQPMIYLAVHGHTYDESKNYVKTLLQKMEKNGYDDFNFGLAIGSLVPVSNHYERIIDIVYGLKDAVRENVSFNLEEIPIHVFGISGYLMPFLSYIGVDSFDSSTYLQAARNLKYLLDGWREIKFYDLNEISCDCEYCQFLTKGGLERSKKILKDKPCQQYSFNGLMINKSEIYSKIAMHNYLLFDKEMNIIRDCIRESTLGEHILEVGLRNPKGRRLLQHIALWDKEIRNRLYKDGLKNHKNKAMTIPVQGHNVRISFEFKPSCFDINHIQFKPNGEKILLLLPCSKEKPYSASKSHKTIQKKLNEAKIDISTVQKVTISGNYGPVPSQYENFKEILGYDYLLSSSAKKRMELLEDRTLKFLNKYGDQYEHIIAYVTIKSYRSVISNALQKYGKGIILPKSLERENGSAFTQQKNIEELVNTFKTINKK